MIVRRDGVVPLAVELGPFDVEGGDLGIGHDTCAQRPNGDRSQNWELALAAFEEAPSVLARERNHELVLPSEVRDNQCKDSYCSIPSESFQTYLSHREIAKARPVGKKRPKKIPAGPPLA